MSRLRSKLIAIKRGTEGLNAGRDKLHGWTVEHLRSLGARPSAVLDVGCGRGDDLERVRDAIPEAKVALHGLERGSVHLDTLHKRGIHAAQCNLEGEAFPWADGTFDVVIVNHVLEHLKDIFWVVSEMGRTLKPGGIGIIGVPNMASLHNRVLLMLGRQPTAIQVFSGHVRGFTPRSLRRFVERGGYFEAERLAGSNFYPLPVSLSPLVSRALPTLSVSITVKARRTTKAGRFVDNLQDQWFRHQYSWGRSAIPGASI